MSVSLLSSLPAPVRDYPRPAAAQEPKPSDAATTSQAKTVPEYGRRQGFVPRKDVDYGGGGAFPEVHVAQYPLGMGKKDAAASNKTLALTTNSAGDINYDALIRQGKNKGKHIVSEHSALIPKIDRLATGEGLEKPSDEEVAKATKETQAALDSIVAKKLHSQQPKSLPQQPGGATYIKYTPANSNPAHNSGASTRIIKKLDMPVDPLEPPKFRITKVPRGQGSPPVPVMHSPPRSVSVKELQEWKVPPCISNWKNPKGYTIPLDKRLAADGRGLQETQINDNFAKVTEALYVAEQKARESIEVRAKLQRERQLREKEQKEKELRDLAARARMERQGGQHATRLAADGITIERSAPAAQPTGGAVGRPQGGQVPAAMDMDEEEPDRDDDPVSRRERERIREERRRERERDRRREAAGGRKSALHRDQDRDVSEKIALGMANVRPGEVMYDQRLFNQEGGMNSGLAGDDAYNLYDKPLYTDRASTLYRPSKAAADEADIPEDEGRRFKPDKGFSGADYSGKGGAGGPVQFEKAVAEDDDVFGLNTLMQVVKTGGKRKADAAERDGGKRDKRH